MPKDQATLGMPSQIGLLKMSVVLDGEQIDHSSLPEIVNNLLTILKLFNSCPEAAIFITQVGLRSFSITATFSEQKKIHEKNGQT
jgi:hypothetical protein